MEPSPVRTYLGLYAYVWRLALTAVVHRLHYLLIAPLTAVAYQYAIKAVDLLVGTVGDPNTREVTRVASGFLTSLIFAAALSLVLFVGRAIIEQRRLQLADLETGMGAFLGDMLTIFFVLWIVGMVLPIAATLLFAAIVILPMFEMAALTPEGGLALFGSVFRFAQRDAFPWLMGQTPLVTVLFVWTLFDVVLLPHVPPLLQTWVHETVLGALVLVGFVYRGVLFLTLDNYSPRRRAERFGGAPGLR